MGNGFSATPVSRITLFCRDLDQSLELYRDILGFKEIENKTIQSKEFNEGLPDLLEPKDEGDEVRWFDDYYTIQKIDERTFAIGEPRYYQLNFNYLIIGDTSAVFSKMTSFPIWS